MDLVKYVSNCTSETRDQLYDSPWTCQALFRSLSPLAKQYILRLLYTDEPIGKGASQQLDGHKFSIWLGHLAPGIMSLEPPWPSPPTPGCPPLTDYLDDWCVPAHRSQHDQALQSLITLQILRAGPG